MPGGLLRLLQAVVFFAKSLVLGFCALPLLCLVDQIAATCAERGTPGRTTATTKKSTCRCAYGRTGTGTLLGLVHGTGSGAENQRHDAKYSQGSLAHPEERYSSSCFSMHICLPLYCPVNRITIDPFTTKDLRLKY